MAERFFRATALAGDLHFIDLSDWEPWDSNRIAYRDETEVRWLVRTGAGERQIIYTAGELDAAIDNSASPCSIYLYVGETLLEETRSRWEKMRRSPGRALFVPDRPFDSKA
jgi:hypothetical protein